MNRARARIKVLVDKFGIDELRAPGRGGARRATGSTSATSTRSRCSSSTTRRPARPPVPVDLREPERRRQRVRALPRLERARRSARRGFSTVQVKVIRGDLTPEQFRGLAQIMRDYSGGYARTTVHQNLVLRWVRDETRLRGLAARSPSSASATPAPTRSPTSSAAPAPTPASSASPARWASTTRCASAIEAMDIDGPAHPADPHQDVRLPERLQPAPHREHRVLRRVDQGRRAHDPGLRRPHRRQLRGRRGRSTARG